MAKPPRQLFVKITNLRVSLWKSILVFSLLLVFLAVAIWWRQEPLFTHLGYVKETKVTPIDFYARNALNPSASLPPQNTEPKASVQRDIDLAQLYAAVQPGKDLDTLFRIASVSPSSCPTIQVPELGAEGICTWINKDKAVIFTLLNNQVISKAKTGF